MAEAKEICRSNGLLQSSRVDVSKYNALFVALAAYRTSAAAAAQQLRDMANELTFKVDSTLLKKQRVGSGVTAGGAGLATLAGIAGLFATGPLIPAALIVGGVVSAGGLAVSFGAGREAEASRKGMLEDVERIFQELEQKLARIQLEIQSLVGDSRDDNVAELDQLIAQLSEDMTDSLAQIPRMTDLREILTNLRRAYSEIPEDWREWAKNNLLSVWHVAGPHVPVGLSMMAGGQPAKSCKAAPAANMAKKGRCSHRYFSACDKGKAQHFSCYTKVGKVVYVAGLAVNVASTVWSVMEVHSLTKKLKELEAKETAVKGKRDISSVNDGIYHRDIAAHLYNKAADLETRLAVLFPDFYD
jgi:hypothetical protein